VPVPRVAFVLVRPVCRPIDGGGVSGLACCSAGPARSTREEGAHVYCGIGSWGARFPSPMLSGAPPDGPAEPWAAPDPVCTGYALSGATR